VLTYISWAPHCSRSDHTARELGGTSHMVYWGWLGSRPSTVLLKYLGQTFATWRIIAREKPEAVFVMSPPPVAVAAVYLACAVRRIPFVVDAHSGAFQHPRWRRFQALQFGLCRRAATTIVTSEHLAELVRGHGGHATVVPDVPVTFGELSPDGGTEEKAFTVVCVTSFDRDEPIEVMVEAARRLPDVPFLMTGRPLTPARLRGLNPPPNLTLTGFLDTAAFGRLIREAGVVVTLTTDDHTMQRGAWEAIYQGTPVIVSDFPILREAFDEGAIHVDNSPAALVDAVTSVKADREPYRRGAARLRTRKVERWMRSKRALLAAIRPGETAPVTDYRTGR
jgi:glycosyltransferase involved in cell wall biosynthesis